MGKTLLKNAHVVLENEIRENCCVLLEDGIITEISSDAENADEVFDLENAFLFPGFIDIHNHGAIGFDVNNCSSEELSKIGEFLLSKGVTAWVPTLVPDSDENYLKVIEAIDEVMEIQDGLPQSQILGVHYEGVFANENMCGALRPEFFRKYEKPGDLAMLPRLKKGKHITTLAPEVENGIELITELVSQNWIVSIGHTKAKTDILQSACNAGAKHMTHFFNAMTGIHHRDLGVAGWGLSNEEMTFDIIADGVHVAPEMLLLAVSNKTVEKASLISDSISPTGLGDGDFEVWNEKISVVNDRTQNERGSIAGSVITVLDAVNMMLSLGFSEIDVARMASLNPAKVLGLENNRGLIAAGKRADFAVVNESGELAEVIIGGEVIT